MNRFLKSIILYTFCLGMGVQASATNDGFARGADVSWLTQMEAEGRKFYTPGENRREMECMQLLRDYCGVNSIRLRVWVNPKDGWNSIDDVVVKAVRAKKLGLRTMIDFHFSDTWADPGHQVMPEAWKGLSFKNQCAALADHVTATLNALKKADVTPEWVQIGNETTPGMMLPVGSVDNPVQLTALNNAGYDAVKSVCPDAKVIVHLDSGNNQWIYDRMFDILRNNGGKYDMIGMSLYPYWAEQNGETGGWLKVANDCIANIHHLKQKYGKPIMICEIGTPYDQADTCYQLIAKMMKTDVEGIFYWEPQAPNGYNDGYNLGCFDNDAPTIALDAFKIQTAQRTVQALKSGWFFCKGDTFDADKSQEVSIPHDWAIYGPFDRKHDLQVVAVEQNGEKVATEKTGRTGGLPFIGKGVYRTTFELADTTHRSITLIFDGVMSHPRIKLNGKETAYWPYGYNSFYVDVNGIALPGSNELEVSCENKEGQSRWYPGAGIYRNVYVVTTDKVHIPTWGTFVTTPTVSDDFASVQLSMDIAGTTYRQNVGVSTIVLDPKGNEVAKSSEIYCARGQEFTQSFLIEKPDLWSPENPALYTARTILTIDGREVDQYDTRFGIRSIDYVPEKGFFLNGKPTKFKGVCNHHDLGPLGAAINRSALRHQIELLKDMGANAIRTSHNMPAPELVELCDELGMMMMIEPFDDWGFRPKSPNGYGAVFNEWAEKDISNMVRHFRNNPSVVMWSIGNEVPSQWGEPGIGELMRLRNAVRSLDNTRPITCGMDQMRAVVDNGFAAALDIPGFNYKPQHYDSFYEKLPQKIILGSETASTVSSRGQYFFPVEFSDHKVALHPGNQSNSYDNESCSWSNVPDLDFARDDDHPWVIGQFVWTGFDYLGEPSPYDTDAWPSHSSVFGIIDLASLPKDRYYLYRSKWNEASPTLHILPHWNWEGREGEITPVFVYTSYPKAELFINGKSQGMREKNDSTVYNRYRLMWNDTRYEQGEVKVIAYDKDGRKVAEKVMHTAGKPHHLVVKSNRKILSSNGEDLAYITIQVADKAGNIVPTDSRKVKFAVKGAGKFEATANGDPTSLMPFHHPEMNLFSGAATAIIRSSNTPGELTFTVSASGVKPATITIPVQ